MFDCFFSLEDRLSRAQEHSNAPTPVPFHTSPSTSCSESLPSSQLAWPPVSADVRIRTEQEEKTLNIKQLDWTKDSTDQGKDLSFGRGIHGSCACQPQERGHQNFEAKLICMRLTPCDFHPPITQSFQIGINYETRAYLSNTSDDSSKVNEVYKKLGVDLSDSALKTQAITHKSFAHGSLPTNEKLGYLGKERRGEICALFFCSRDNAKPCLLDLGY